MKQEHVTTEQLIDYLHGELAPGDDAHILQHLEHCGACAAAYDEQARVTEALRAYARASERELPQGVVNRIWDQIEREERSPSWGARIAAFWRPAVAVPVAAVLVVGAFFGFTATHHAAVTTIDASYYLQDHAAITGTVPFSEGIVVPSGLGSAGTTTTADVATPKLSGSLVADAR